MRTRRTVDNGLNDVSVTDGIDNPSRMSVDMYEPTMASTNNMTTTHADPDPYIAIPLHRRSQTQLLSDPHANKATLQLLHWLNEATSSDATQARRLIEEAIKSRIQHVSACWQPEDLAHALSLADIDFRNSANNLASSAAPSTGRKRKRKTSLATEGIRSESGKSTTANAQHSTSTRPESASPATKRRDRTIANNKVAAETVAMMLKISRGELTVSDLPFESQRLTESIAKHQGENIKATATIGRATDKRAIANDKVKLDEQRKILIDWEVARRSNEGSSPDDDDDTSMSDLSD